MRVVSLAGASSVTDPQYGEADAGRDGVFELPLDFAEHLLKTAAGLWRTEAEHVAQLAREDLESLRDPKVALRVLSDLRERVQSLESEIAALKAAAPAADSTAVQVPAVEGEAAPAADVPAEPELTPQQKAAATRAAKKAEAEKAAAETTDPAA